MNHSIVSQTLTVAQSTPALDLLSKVTELLQKAQDLNITAYQVGESWGDVEESVRCKVSGEFVVSIQVKKIKQ